MNKDNLNTTEYIFEKHLSNFENEVRNILSDLDNENLSIFLEKFSQKLNEINIKK